VERLVPLSCGVVAAEQLQRLALRCRGESEEADVVLLAARRHGLGQRLVHGVHGQVRILCVGGAAGAQHPPQLLGRLTGLRGVRLVPT
jgi:hypothetical protein